MKKSFPLHPLQKTFDINRKQNRKPLVFFESLVRDTKLNLIPLPLGRGGSGVATDGVGNKKKFSRKKKKRKMIDAIKKLERQFSAVFDKKTAQYLLSAAEFAYNAHIGQKRKSGEDYITHPFAVAKILLELKVHCSAVAAALLHDVIEDCGVSKEELIEKFGEAVADIVEGVTKLHDLQFRKHEEQQAENFRRMFFAMAKNHLVIVVKLADRLHNMRTIKALSPIRQKEIARETLDIYAPLAGRLGLSYIKCELEDNSLKTLMPEEYKKLVKDVGSKRAEFESTLEKIISKLEVALEKFNIKGKVSGRPKHYYSIYRKMHRPGDEKSLEQIYDLTAVRVIVDTVEECYIILGAVHSLYKPLRERFKDYIAVPKINNYRSLHTTVMTEFSSPTEIQIRTKEMHEVAEYGIAAHWKYKEGKAEGESDKENSLEQKLAWLRHLTDLEKEESTAATAGELYKAVKFDFSQKEIFVFTPNGEIIVLPEGATPIDFAYRVHTEVGNACVGARVNKKMVPHSVCLKSGDLCEIITSKTSKGPSRDWLRFVKTTQAISKIKSFFKKLLKDENIQLGKEMLEAESKKKGVNLGVLLNQKWLETVLTRYSLSSLDDMYAAIGYGGIGVGHILPKLIAYHRREEKEKEFLKDFDSKSKPKEKSGGVIIDGFRGLALRLARCCAPVPGDNIIGFLSRGKGVSVHKQSCPNIRNAEKERLINAEWSENQEGAFLVKLQIEAVEHSGLINKVSACIAELGLSIDSLSTKVAAGKGIILLGVQVKEASQIKALTKKIETIKSVDKVFRV